MVNSFWLNTFIKSFIQKCKLTDDNLFFKVEFVHCVVIVIIIDHDVVPEAQIVGLNKKRIKPQSGDIILISKQTSP